MIIVINFNINDTILIMTYEQNTNLEILKSNVDTTLSLRTRKQFAFQLTSTSKCLQQKRSNNITVIKITLVLDQLSYLI